jgi:hypothetical protein
VPAFRRMVVSADFGGRLKLTEPNACRSLGGSARLLLGGMGAAEL